MPYIGRDTDKLSNVEVLDNITFNGSSSYTLQKGGTNYTPSSANNILVSIDGVVQAGNFTVSGSTIDFGTAIAGTSTCDFIIHYGIGLITTPADGTVTTAKIQDSAITPVKLGYDYNQYRNIIINGDMSIAQRSTSVAGITSTGYYTVDRWNLDMSSAGTWTQSQSTDVPTGQGFAKSLKYDCTTANASLSAGAYMIIEQKFEGQNLQYIKKGTANAESLTLSFWVKSNKTGTYIAELIETDSAPNRTISKSYTINSADTWEKKTITYAGDTSGIINNDNGESLKLRLWLATGSTFSNSTLNTSWNIVVLGKLASGQVNLADSTSNYINITGVQLEAGTTASDFEFLPYDVNLQRCYRYFQSLDLGQLGFGFATTSGQWMYINVGLSTVMRANPTATQGSTSASGSTNAIGVGITRPQQFVYQLQASGSGSDIYALTTSAQITLSAEL